MTRTHRTRASIVSLLDFCHDLSTFRAQLLDLGVIVSDLDQAVEVLFRNIASDVLAGEDGAIERLDRRVELLARLDEIRQGLEDDEVGSDLGRDFSSRPVVGDEFVRGRHVDTVDIGESEKGR